jgi:hypothetical protein
MNTLPILALVLVICLFGGYADSPKQDQLAPAGSSFSHKFPHNKKVTKMMKLDPSHLIERRLSLWFALLSPLLGILTGLAGVFIFSH